tara:strand:+ start:2366 stop:3589 length:1224 start_codon:yes stop_codon:yes gene_type:complete
MKIVVTGASGFVGQLLVPRLAALGVDLLLVGRDTKKLGQLYPEIENCNYNQLAVAGAGADSLVNLAVANSNSRLSREKFYSINVDFLLQIVKKAQSAKIPRFINVSSVHALQSNNNTAYANSKRAGVKALELLEGYQTETVYLATVYGERWSGRLAILNGLPNFLAKLLFVPIAAAKPVLHIDRFVDHLTDKGFAANSHTPVVLADDKAQNPLYDRGIRSMDLMFAISIALFLGWAMVLIGLMVRLNSKGPSIFVQTRVGKNQKPFSCYKFRTMKQGTRQSGTHEISVARVTSIGAILRKTKIDELPQIFNIFRNELSLIGPRPCLPSQVELIDAREACGVFSIKPGITGLAQVHNIDMSTPELLVEWDARYAALRSLATDLSIVIATATGSGQGDKINSVELREDE